MTIPWFRRRFLARRRLDRIFFDLPDAVWRHITGRGRLPPYSLRSFVGGAANYEEVGRAFVNEAWELDLFGPGARILDVGCGCGRMASALAAYPRLRELEISYTGMDVDRDCIEWCRQNFAPFNRGFQFYQADCANPSYNPSGSTAAFRYAFPHKDHSFDLIVLTSVMTHLLEDDLRQYLAEASRMLAPGGVVYASFFLYESLADASRGAARHGIAFPFRQGNSAVNREDYPTNAVAWEEPHIRRIAEDMGLETVGPARYGQQDLLLFGKAGGQALSQLGHGWHELEEESWRWTERRFSVRLVQADKSGVLRFRFQLPAAVMNERECIRLRARAGDLKFPSSEYTAPGAHLYACEIPAQLSAHGSIEIEFELDTAQMPSSADARELGLQVMFMGGSGAYRRRLEPFVVCGG